MTCVAIYEGQGYGPVGKQVRIYDSYKDAVEDLEQSGGVVFGEWVSFFSTINGPDEPLEFIEKRLR